MSAHDILRPMLPIDRYAWLLEYMTKHPGDTFDVCKSDFVDDYIRECRPSKVAYMPYGAHKVPQLGRDLSQLYLWELLKRNSVGLGDMGSGLGFPRYVYAYRLTLPGPIAVQSLYKIMSRPADLRPTRARFVRHRRG
jgi:hypothetical protein